MCPLLHIAMLGTVKVSSGDTELELLPNRKVLSVLVRLAISPGEVVRREYLMEMLWPEEDQALQQGRLRTTLSLIRKMLGDAHEALAADRSTVSLLHNQVITDRAQFLQAFAQADKATDHETRLHWLQQAAQTYQGLLAPEIQEEWIETERSYLASLYQKTLLQASLLFLRLQNHERAFIYALKAVETDPLQEEAQAHLMRIQMAAGDHAAARQQYMLLEKRMLKTLGISPSPETLAIISGDSRQQHGGQQEGISLAASPHNRQNLIFGREAELQAIVEQLKPEAQAGQLLTLTGPGGIGKTSIAREALQSLAPLYRQRVWFVRLADLIAASQIEGAILRAMHISQVPGLHPLNQIVEYLADEPALLVLDTFEHLLEDGRLLTGALMEMAPALRILVTSRRSLHLPGEAVLPIGPLVLPDFCGETAELAERFEQFITTPAAQMFTHRAKAVRTGFQVAIEEQEDFLWLCRRLEGIPLAIELAAAKTGVLTLGQIRSLLEKSYHILTEARESKEERHRSLTAAIEWSYHLLTTPQKKLFCFLSLFSGGCPSGALCIPEQNVMPDSLLTGLNCVDALRNSSLITVQESSGDMFYHMPDSMKEFGREKLSSQERRALEIGILQWYREQAEKQNLKLRTLERSKALRWFRREQSNLFRCMEIADTQHLREEELRLGYSLCRYFWVRGMAQDGLHLMQHVLNRIPFEEEQTCLRARLMAHTAILCWDRGKHQEALKYLEAIIPLLREKENGLVLAEALFIHALVMMQSNASQHTIITAELQEALLLARAAGYQQDIARALFGLGSLSNDPQKQREYLVESIQIAESAGDQERVVWSRFGLANLCMHQEQFPLAEHILQQAHMLAVQLEDIRAQASLCQAFANLYNLSGRQQEKMLWMLRGTEMFRQSGHLLGYINSSLGCIAYMVTHNRSAEAQQILQRLYADIVRTDRTDNLTILFEEMTLRSVEFGLYTVGARLLGKISSHTGYIMHEAYQSLASGMGEQALQEEMEIGKISEAEHLLQYYFHSVESLPGLVE